MNIINPLTLIIIPILGSLVIISFPRAPLPSEEQLSASNEGSNVTNYMHVTEVNTSTVQLQASLKREPGATEGDPGTERLSLNPSLIELLNMPEKENINSNLKKIAITTSLINFIFSILL